MSSAALGILNLANGFGQANAHNIQGMFEQQQAEGNARLNEIYAEDALRRGNKEAESHMKKVGQIVGSQRAALAAQGIDINSGTAAQTQEDTKTMGSLDALSIKNNAWRESWGYKVNADQLRGAGKMAKFAAQQNANNSILTGAISATQNFYESTEMKKIKIW